MEFDFIIIGSGLGGLVSGIILAKEGYSVCILEKNHQAGGNMQTFEREGHTFSTGLHYIGGMDEGQTLHRFFNYIGIAKDLKLKRLDPEGYDRISFGDEGTVYSYAQGWENFIDSLSSQFPSERDSISIYADTVKQTIRSIPLYNLETAGTSNLDSSTLGRCTMPFLGSITKNKRLQNVLAAGNSVYHGAAHRTPFYVHSCIRNSFVGSAWKMAGGSGQLAELLGETLSSSGGKVWTDSEVISFKMIDNKIVSVVLKDGNEVFGKTFISNLHPAATLSMDGLDNLKGAYRKRIESLENTAGFFSLYLVFKEDFFPYLDYNFFHYSDDQYFNDNLDKNEWPHTFMVYTPFYEDGQKFSRTASVLSFMDTGECRKWIGLPPEQRSNDYDDFKEMKAQKLLDDVEKRFPGIRGGIEKYYVSTPVTFRDFTGTPDGSGYGILKDCHDPVRSIIVPRTKIPNLYFTGQNLNIHGVLGTTISAIVTCSEFTGFRNLVNKIIHA
jgi:all-trans-retinol 13,14-reductase